MFDLSGLCKDSCKALSLSPDLTRTRSCHQEWPTGSPPWPGGSAGRRGWRDFHSRKVPAGISSPTASHIEKGLHTDD